MTNGLKHKTEVHPYIVGGRDTRIEKHPYQVHIQLRRGVICSGAIISEYMVLTAGHCVHGETPSSLSLHYGTSTKRGGKSHQCKKLKLHPEYNDVTLNYDVGLVWVRILFYVLKKYSIDLSLSSQSFKSSIIYTLSLINLLCSRRQRKSIWTIKQKK